MTLLVIDDEYWIRYKLVHQFDWARFGILTILEAANGEAATEVMKRERVDVILTDMDMPFMNGETLIGWVQANYPETFILVLSGYSDFSMVRSAMVGGALDYLLKPVQEKELYAALERIRDRISVRELEQAQKQQLRMSAERGREQQRDLWMSRVISGEMDKEDLPAPTDIMEPYRIVDISVAGMRYAHDDNAAEQRSKRERVLKNIVSQELNLHKSHVFLNVNACYECVALINAEHLEEDFSARLKSLHQRLAEERWILRSFIACGPACAKWEALAQNYQSLQRLCSAMPVRRESHCLATEQDLSEKRASVRRLTDHALGQITRAIQTGNGDVAADILEDTFNVERMVYEGWLYYELSSAAQDCARLIIATYERMGASIDNLNALWNIRFAIEEALKRYDAVEAAGLLTQMVQAAEPPDGKAEEMSLIDEIRAYVDDHYTESLTLSLLAERFHVSTSYLSRSFKKKTNQNLISYITDLRMAAARNLLLKNKCSVADVAFQVGYDDYSYFGNIFRRHFGVSPREFQKKAGKESV